MAHFNCVIMNAEMDKAGKLNEHIGLHRESEEMRTLKLLRERLSYNTSGIIEIIPLDLRTGGVTPLPCHVDIGSID